MRFAPDCVQTHRNGSHYDRDQRDDAYRRTRAADIPRRNVRTFGFRRAGLLGMVVPRPRPLREVRLGTIRIDQVEGKFLFQFDQDRTVQCLHATLRDQLPATVSEEDGIGTRPIHRAPSLPSGTDKDVEDHDRRENRRSGKDLDHRSSSSSRTTCSLSRFVRGTRRRARPTRPTTMTAVNNKTGGMTQSGQLPMRNSGS